MPAVALDLDDVEFMSDNARALDELEHTVDQVAIEAAEQGVQAEQGDHPYQDQTYNLSAGAHVEPHTGSEELNIGASMVWPAPYASFVQQGTKEQRIDLPPEVELEGDESFGGTATATASGKPGGNAPYPFVEVAIERAKNVLEAGLDEAIDKYERSAG